MSTDATSSHRAHPLPLTRTDAWLALLAGYKEGDLPVTEGMVRRLVFLPMLSDPVPGAAERVIEAIRRGTRRVRLAISNT